MMRITITNDEPGFSDARIAIKVPGFNRIVLSGGKSIQMTPESGMDNQITLQALRREGDPEDKYGHD